MKYFKNDVSILVIVEMGLVDAETAGAKKIKGFRFNPCYSGNGFGSTSMDVMPVYNWLFQSLL